MKRWQRVAVALWAVLVAGGCAVVLLLGDGSGEPPPGPPPATHTPSGPARPQNICASPGVVCSATFVPFP